ncbi:MAG TPA: chloride channel protein, partial [Anaerolineae bacterium]|nr:chloride channel protein [Anaerolineae bacterium]
MTNPDDKTIPDQPMISLALMAIAVGIIAGFGAVGFRLLIGLVHNLLFLGQFSFIYDANEHTPFSVWGIG